MTAALPAYQGIHNFPQTCRIPVTRLKAQHSTYTPTPAELARWQRERERETQRWLAFLREGYLGKGECYPGGGG